MPDTLDELADRLAAGTTTSRELIEVAIARRDRAAHVFVHTDDAAARARADAIDSARGAGRVAGRYAGIPISVKDLFDVAGQVTRAGSVVLGDAQPAESDAPVVTRLADAGFVTVGRTNMTEFAYSGLGVNPHFSTPPNPFDRGEDPRVPGGSSSGAAVSVAEGMAAAAIGTDTGGSCRIPAAFCGIVGFKPTASRIPREGVFPLSASLDSVGPLARSVRCCQILDSVMAGLPLPGPRRMPVTGIRLGVLTDYVTDAMAPPVARAYTNALTRLTAAGAELTDVPSRQLAELPDINARGGIAAAEAWHHHRELLSHSAVRYDPRVAARIAAGGAMSAADLLDCIAARRRLIAWARSAFLRYDAVLLPTAPLIAPRMSELAADDDYVRINLLALRNPSVANFLDGCAISIPIHDPGTAPVGLGLMSLGDDGALLDIASAVENTVGTAIAGI